MDYLRAERRYEDKVDEQELPWTQTKRRADNRTPFQHDHDRVIHSDAFRRLGQVTQIVDSSEGHVFHNRLTHTLKVAQIARRLAERLHDQLLEQVYRDEAAKQLDAINQSEAMAVRTGALDIVSRHLEEHDVVPEEVEQTALEEVANRLDAIGGLDPEVVATGALIHDLGHPPFGHVAEKVLDALVREYGGVEDGYEGNAQSFRIVARLEVRRKNQQGLNLTRATLNAVLKYPWTRQGEPGQLTWQKYGAYEEDETYFRWVRHAFGDSKDRALEAQVMEWADDIAFSVHDLEDFYRAGMIPLDRLAWNREYREISLRKIFERWDSKPRPDRETDRVDFRGAFVALADRLPFLEPFEGSMTQRAQIRNVSSGLIGRFVENTDLDLTSTPNDYLAIPRNIQLEVKALKELVRVYVVDSPTLATQQYGKAMIIKTLFELLFEAPEAYTWTSIYPQRFHSRLAEEVLSLPKNNSSRARRKARLVADVISSLTDNEALVLYHRLTGTNPGPFVTTSLSK